MNETFKGKPNYLPKCDHCGDIKIFLIDGYDFRDRQMEGVLFAITVEDVTQGLWSIQPFDPTDMAYLSDFNIPKLYEEAIVYAVGADIVDCAICEEQIDGPDGGVMVKDLQ